MSEKTSKENKAHKTAAKETSKGNSSAEAAAAINDTFGGSPVTTELSGSGAAQPDGERQVDLSKARITVPQSAVTAAGSSADTPPAARKQSPAADSSNRERDDDSFAARAMKAGIGEVRVEGIDFRYIGLAPGRDREAKTPSGYPVTTDNSRFTPLSEVAFSPGLRYKDPKTGAYYFAPEEATSFAEVNLDGETLA